MFPHEMPEYGERMEHEVDLCKVGSLIVHLPESPDEVHDVVLRCLGLFEGMPAEDTLGIGHHVGVGLVNDMLRGCGSGFLLGRVLYENFIRS